MCCQLAPCESRRTYISTKLTHVNVISVLDWGIFYDQPVFSRHSDPVFRDKKARDGTYAAGAKTFPLDEHAREQLGAGQLLRRDH